MIGFTGWRFPISSWRWWCENEVMGWYFEVAAMVVVFGEE